MKIFAVISPTWALADYLKKKNVKNRTRTIKTLNSVYLWLSIVSTVAIAVYQKLLGATGSTDLYSSIPSLAVILWSYFLLSRGNEIFYAFLTDAFDKMVQDKEDPTDTNGAEIIRLKPCDRIKLSLKKLPRAHSEFCDTVCFNGKITLERLFGPHLNN